MFSTRLEPLRQFNGPVLAAATLLAVGIALITILAVRAFIGAAEADRAPIIIGVLIGPETDSDQMASCDRFFASSEHDTSEHLAQLEYAVNCNSRSIN
jgi:hypothetical protein